MVEQVPTFKLLLAGNGGVGKTSFIKRHVTGEFEETYVPTLGVQIYHIEFTTTNGKVRFEVWDIAG